MDVIVIYIEAKQNYIHLQFSDSGAATEDCDECIDYTLFNTDKEELDGGQMDYNSDEKQYQDIRDTVADIIDFVYDEDLSYTETDLTLEDIQQ